MSRRALWVVAVSLLLHLLLAAWLPLSGDESYHWWWAMHPALSYQEHPPLQAWLIRIAVTLFGHHAWAVRLPAILSGVAVACLLERMLREWPVVFTEKATEPAERAPARFLILLNLLPLYFVLGAYANNDMLYYALTLAALLGVGKWLGSSREEGRDLFWLAPLLALALLAKLIALFFLPAIIYGLWRAEKPLPRRFWAGTILGGLLFLPFLIWNFSHGWPLLAIRFGHKTRQFAPLQFLLELIGPELLGVTPLLMAGGLLLLSREWKGGSARKFWWLAAAPILVFYHLAAAFQHVDLHWPFFGFLILLPILWAQRPGWRTPLLVSAGLCSLAIFIAAALLLGGTLPAWRYALRPQRFNTRKAQAQFIGWAELKARLEQESQALGPDGFLMAEGYGMLTQSLFLLQGKREGFLVENPVRSGGSIAYFEAGHAPPAGAAAFFVTETKARSGPEIRRKLGLLFTVVEPLTPLRICRGADVCREFELLRLRGFKGFAARRSFYKPEFYLAAPAVPYAGVPLAAP